MKSLVVLLGLATFTACGGADDETREDEDRPRMTEDGLRIDYSDVDSDGQPDVIKYFRDTTEEATGETVHLLVSTEIDLDYDGTFNLRREYDERGDLMREDMDSNLDGVFDRTIYWEEGLIVRSEMDHNNDGAVDQYRYYENGFLNRVLTDDNHDGEVDRWAYYDRVGLQRVGTDRNGDGEADTWSERQSNP